MVTPEFNSEESRFDVGSSTPPLVTDVDASDEVKVAKSKKPLAIGVSALVGVGMLVGTFALVNVFDNGPVKDGETAEPVTKAVQAAPSKWYSGKEVPAVVPMPEWATEQVNATPALISDEDFLEEAYKAWEGTKTLDKAKVSYRSEDLATSDPTEAFDKIGLPNPDYTFVSEEIFVGNIEAVTTKFLNPVAGGWSMYQHSSADAKYNFDPVVISDVITPEYRSRIENAGDRSFVPIMADWNANDYGIPNLVPQGTRWIGTVDDSDVRLVWNDKLVNYDVYVTSDVTFTSWTAEKTRITREGTLSLKLVANKAAANDYRLLRLLVADGSLELK